MCRFCLCAADASLLCDLAYRTLTHPSIKEQRVNDAVFLILGKAVKSHNHAMAFPVQIVQIMERDEIAVVPIARGIAFLNQHFSITTILGHLLKEFIDKLNMPNASPTTSKHLAMFITEIGDQSSELALQCLQHSQDILNLEVIARLHAHSSAFVPIHPAITSEMCGPTEALNAFNLSSPNSRTTFATACSRCRAACSYRTFAAKT